MARGIYTHVFSNPNICSSKNQRTQPSKHIKQVLLIFTLTIVETWPFCVSVVKGRGDSRHQVSFVWIIYQKPYRLLWQQNRLLPRRFVIIRYRKLIRFVPSIEIFQVHKIRIWSKLRSWKTVQSTRIDRSCGRCTVHGLLPQCQMSEMLSLSSCWILSNRIDE